MTTSTWSSPYVRTFGWGFPNWASATHDVAQNTVLKAAAIAASHKPKFSNLSHVCWRIRANLAGTFNLIKFNKTNNHSRRGIRNGVRYSPADNVSVNISVRVLFTLATRAPVINALASAGYLPFFTGWPTHALPLDGVSTLGDADLRQRRRLQN